MKEKKMTITNGIRIIWKVFQRGLLAILMLPAYLIIGYLPRDKNLWVFISWETLYNDNSRMLFEWVDQNHKEIKSVWISNSEEVIRRIRDEKRKAFHRHSLSAIFMFMRAGKVFTSTGDNGCLFFMNGTDWYNVWHGMPLKQIRNSIAQWEQKTYPISKVKRFIIDVSRKVFRWHDWFGLKTHRTVVNSPFFIPILMDAFRLPEEDVLKTGSPRCDALFFNRPEPLLENLRTKFPGCKIILYMPTFRSYGKYGSIFDPFIEKYGFNEIELEKALERNNSILLYKAHFTDLSKKSKMRDAHSRFMEISDKDYDELYNLVGQIDVLVTDYSSIYFDFLATKNPVILCPFDYEEYIKYSRPLYFDYFENMEGVKAMNWQEFIRILDEKSYYPVSEATRMKFAEYIDGNCCQKLFDAVMACDREKCLK